MTSFGTAFGSGVRTVRVHSGARGPQGLPGGQGPQGDPGQGITITGPWSYGTTYCPGDAVSFRSTLLDGVDSLYIQRDASPCAASTTAPNLDGARWEEVGAVQFGNAFGGIWEVFQADHGFQYVGTPVAFDLGSNAYVAADASVLSDLGIAVVREVIDSDRVVLQSSGEVPYIDSRVIWPDGSSWEPGAIYYVSDILGRVQVTVPASPGAFSNPILMPTDAPAPGARNGIALPWTPQAAAATPNTAVVSPVKFWYTATAGQTVFTGADRNGNVLSYVPGTVTTVFRQGLNLADTGFTATDGSTVELTVAASLNDTVEIWTAGTAVQPVIPSTVQKVDNIEGDFNGGATVFPILVGAVAIPLDAAENVLVFLDVHAQEAGVDYTIVEDPGNAGFSALQFAEPIPAGTRFFGYLYQPYAGGVTSLSAAIDELGVIGILSAPQVAQVKAAAGL